jgi:hypothetical protein
VICNGAGVPLGDGDGLGACDGLGEGEGLRDGEGLGVGLPVISSHQYVSPLTTEKIVELPGNVAISSLMPVSNSVSSRVSVVPSKVSNARGPALA